MVKKILHIEDDGDTRLLVKALLERHGYLVSNAVSGSECLNKLRKENFDLVLLDVMLPDMSGWGVLGKIRKNLENNDVKVAFLSMIPVSDATMDVLKKSGVEDYITKPFNNEDLVRRIEFILGR